MKLLEKHNMLYEGQFGFSARESYYQGIVESIETCWGQLNGEHVGITLCDLRKAFD